MIHAKVKVFEYFPEITARVDAAARAGVDAAAEEALEVAQANAKHDLELVLVPAEVDLGAEGYSGGIKSRRASDVDGSMTPLAVFWDKGTLGRRRGKLKQPGRQEEQWTVKRAGGSYTAHRQRPLPANTGLEAERFFARAKAAGRVKMLERIQEELA